MDRRAIDWRGSSYKDLRDMPEAVQLTFGYALAWRRTVFRTSRRRPWRPSSRP